MTPENKLLAMGFALLVMLGLLIFAVLFKNGPQSTAGAAINLGGLGAWLKQHGDYLGIVGLGVNNYAARRGWIDAELASTLNYGLSVLTGAAFVAKTNRNSLKIDAAVEQATDAAAIATQTHAELRKGRPVTPLTPAKGVQDVRTDVPVKEVP